MVGVTTGELTAQAQNNAVEMTGLLVETMASQHITKMNSTQTKSAYAIDTEIKGIADIVTRM